MNQLPMSLRDATSGILTAKVFFCLLLILFVLINFSYSQTSKTCEDYFYSDNHSTITHPAFVKAYAQIAKAYKTQKKSDFDHYILDFIEATDTLKEHACWEGYAYGMTMLGASYLSMQVFENEFKKAMPYLSKVKALGIDKLESNHILRGKGYYYIGKYYYQNHQSDSAIYFFNKSLKVFDNKIKENGISIYLSYFGLAQVYLHRKHNIELAEKYFDDFMAVREHPQYDPSKDLSQYHAFYKLRGYKDFASKYFMLSDYDKALSYAFKFKDSVNIYPRNQDLHLLHASQLLGTLHAKKGIHQIARNHFQKADSILDNSPDYLDPINLERAKNMLGLAESLLQLNQHEKARVIIKKGLSIIQEEKNPQVVQVRAQAYRKLGVISIASQDWTKAKQHIKISNNIYAELSVEIHHEIAKNYLYLAQIEKFLGYNNRALAHISWAEKIVLSKERGSSQNIRQQVVLDVYQEKGDLLACIAQQAPNQEKSYDAPIKAYEKAINLLRQNLYELERESSLFKVKESSYVLFEQALACIWDAYYHSQNPKYLRQFSSTLEASKSLALLSRLGDLEMQDTYSEASASEERKLKMNLSYYESELSKLDKTETHFESKYSNISQRILELEDRLTTIRKENTEKEVLQSTSSRQLLHSIDIKSNSFNQLDMAFLSFFWGKKAIYTFFNYKNGRQSIHKIAKTQKLEKDIYALHNHLSHQEKQSTHEKQVYKEFTYLAHSIYVDLLAPILKGQSTKGVSQELLILPDGPMSLIPLEILLSEKAPEYFAGYKDLPYLLHNYTISYSPSLSYIKRKKVKARSRSKSGILAFSYSKDIPYFKGAKRRIKRGTNLGELPGSYHELQSIANYFDGTFLMGSEARKDSFLKEAPYFNIIHLSLHGKAGGNTNPHLIFPPIKGVSNEETLYDYELRGIGLQAQMAILSACESGLGTYIPGEGLQGMAQSFLSSGCESVIMSLWEVDDKSTANLMESLYHNFSLNLPLDEALAASKKQYLKQSDPYKSHPSYWSSFILNGKNKPLDVSAKGEFRFTFITLSLLGVIFLSIVAKKLLKENPQIS